MVEKVKGVARVPSNIGTCIDVLPVPAAEM
jgi:hypothetical protein